MSIDRHLLGPIPPPTAQAWATAELGQAALGDPRRTRRLVQVAAAVAAQPQASLAQACGDPARTKAAYRFFEGAETSFHDRPAAIRAAHCHATQARVAAQPVVLAVQETTSLNFTGHVVADVGALDRPGQYGLFVHSTLAVLPDSGVPQGLLAQEVWARPAAPPGGRRPRRTRPVAAKESQKWLTALAASRATVPPGVTLVHVGDREADVYDLFLAAAAQPGTELLIRAAQDRRVQGPTGTLWAALAAQPVRDTRCVELPQANDRPARAVELSLRWTRVTLRPAQGPGGRAPARAAGGRGAGPRSGPDARRGADRMAVADHRARGQYHRGLGTGALVHLPLAGGALSIRAQEWLSHRAAASGN
jgi:hypothetical protein